MQMLKKPLSILLSLIMICSVFTIIPMTASAEGNPTATLSKWVETTQEDQDEFSFEGLYDNFIFCRVNPSKDPNEEADPWAQNVVYDKTNDLSMTGTNPDFAKNDNNYYQLDNYYSDNSHRIWGTWQYSQYFEDSDLIYLKDNDVHFSDGCVFWAYTWKDVALTEHDGASPTYVNGTYKNGTDRTYYTCEEDGVYFVYDGGSSSYVRISEADLFTVPYFEYEYLHDDYGMSTIRLAKCNSDDADVTVPDTAPAQYWPTGAPDGTTCTIIKEGAFAGLTSLVNVTIGDTVNHLAEEAFKDCSALETVTVGNYLDYVGEDCFDGCTSLTDFTTTSTREFTDIEGLSDIAYTNEMTVHCYHDSDIARELYDMADFIYLDASYSHTYRVWEWDWDNFDNNHTVSATIDCSVCYQDIVTLNANIVEVVDDPPTCTKAGSGYYVATVTIDGRIYEDDDDGDHTFTIPAAHTWASGSYTAAWTPNQSYLYNDQLDDVSCAITFVCTECGDTHTVAANDVDLSYITIDPGCASEGAAVYTATATYEGVTVSATKTYAINPTGEHTYDWNNGTWYWEGLGGINFSDPYSYFINGNINAEYVVHCTECNQAHYAPASIRYDYNHPAENCMTPQQVSFTATVRSDSSITDTQVLTGAAGAHSLERHTATDPTATLNGNTEYWLCTVCGKYYSDSNGTTEIAQADTVIPALNTVEEGKVFTVGDEIVIPAGTVISLYARTGSAQSDHTFDTRTIKTVTYYRTEVHTYGKGNLAFSDDNQRYLRGATSNADYVFTGYYQFTDEFNTGVLTASAIYYKRATAPTWSDWGFDDSTATVTLDDFYDSNDANAQQVDNAPAQTLTATIDSEVTAEPGNITWGERTYTATATAYHGTFTDTKTEPIEPYCEAYLLGPGNMGSFSTEAINTISQNGLYTVVLVKNVSDPFEFPVLSGSNYSSFVKVKKNGYNVTVTAPACYSISESTDSNGVTTYTLTGPNHNYRDGLYYTLSESDGAYTITMCADCVTCGETTIMTSATATKHDAVAATCSSTGSVEYYTIDNGNYYYVPAANPAHENELTAVSDPDELVIPINGEHVYSADPEAYTWTWTPDQVDDPGISGVSAHMNVPCIYCDHVLEVNAPSVELAYTPATCAAAGLATYTAVVTYNGANYTGTKSYTGEPATGQHNLTHIDEAPATCTSTGTCEHWLCLQCDKLFSDENGENEISASDLTIPITGHTWEVTWSDDDPEQLVSEYWDVPVTFTCSVCGESVAHYGWAKADEIQTVDATCTTGGYKSGHFEARYDGVLISDKTIEWDRTLPLGHNMTHHEAQSSTCLAEGNTEYYSCDRCGKYFSDETGDIEISENSWIVPFADHTYLCHEAVEATCTAPGNSEYYECALCHKYFEEVEGVKTEISENSWVIPAHHTLTAHPAVAATCTEEGNTAYWECTVCEKYFADADATEEIDEDDWVVDPIRHRLDCDDVEWYNLSLFGYEYRPKVRCLNCHEYVIGLDNLEDSENFGSFTQQHLVRYEEPECDYDGYYVYCARIRIYSDTIPFIFHDIDSPEYYVEDEDTRECDSDNLVRHEAHAATCTAPGNTEYWECDNCGRFYSTDTGTDEYRIEEDSWVINALGHNMTHHESCSATCNEAGNTEYWSCDRCGKYFSDANGATQIEAESWVIPATGQHTLTHHAAVAPIYDKTTNTMTPGNIEYWECSVCGKYFSDANGENEIALADTVVEYFTFDLNGSNGTARILKYNGTDTDVFIPDTVPAGIVESSYEGVDITCVWTQSFKGNTSVTSVEMGDNVTTIGWEAFKECTALRTVTIGSGLSMLYYDSFTDCTNLESFTSTTRETFVYLPGDNNSTWNRAFYHDSKVKFYGYHGTSFQTMETIHTPGKPFIGIDDHTYTAAWSWTGNDADGYTAATATLSCSACSADSVNVDAVVTKRYTTEATIYTATAAHEGETYTATKTVDGQVFFVGNSLTLNGDIGVNFYLNLTAAQAQKAIVDFSYTVDGKAWTSSVDLKDATPTEIGYKATCWVCAPEMTDTITAVLSIDEETVDTDTYSVKAYADKILSNAYRTEFLAEEGNTEDDYNQLAALVTAMLNYGGATQTQFESEHPNGECGFANEGLAAPAALTSAELEGINMPKPDKTAIDAALDGTGLTYYGYTMLLHSKTTLRIYFEKASPDTSIAGITFGGNAAKNYNKKYAYVEVEAIPAYELNNAYTLSFNDTDLGSYSALTYVKDVLTNQTIASGDPLINTVTAMYRYHQAAVIWFNNSHNG